MMGDLGSQNLFQLIAEVRAQRGVEDADDDEEEGGNRGDRTSVAFPRVAEKKEVLDDPQQETGQVFPEHVDVLLSSQ